MAIGSIEFLDTNVCVYAQDAADPRKQAVAQALLSSASEAGRVLSAQVLNEFFAVCVTKLSMPRDLAATQTRRLASLQVVPNTVQVALDAIDIAVRYSVSIWDANIIAAAKSAGCMVLLSEDLVDDAVYGGLRVTNPFA